MNQVVAVIPSRYASTRFPGKPLKIINGKPLLAWVIEAVKKSQLVDQVIVATDDLRIVELANQRGVETVMTDSGLPSGTDRVWAVAQDLDADLILNIQGDEPLLDGTVIDSLIEPMLADSALEMGTLAHSIDFNELHSENAVKVICNAQQEAIYFSRFSIPFSRQKPSGEDSMISGVLKHIGIYAYRRAFLKKYCECSVVDIEKGESLEQLRALYLGARIKVIPVDYRSWGVDVPEDVQKIEELMGLRKL